MREGSRRCDAFMAVLVHPLSHTPFQFLLLILCSNPFSFLLVFRSLFVRFSPLSFSLSSDLPRGKGFPSLKLSSPHERTRPLLSPRSRSANTDAASAHEEDSPSSSDSASLQLLREKRTQKSYDSAGSSARKDNNSSDSRNSNANMDSVIDSNAARSSSASSRRRNNNTSSSEGAVTIHVRNAEEGDESNQLIRNNNNAGDAAETNETKEDHAADHKSLVASSSSDEEAAKKKALDERVDAAAVAARDPYSPSMPFGSGLEKTKSTATTSSQEGLAQMQHSNPSSVAELFGFNSPEDADYSETNPTGNVGKFPRKVLLQIAKRFQPIVWLSPTEQYRPCRMEWYLDHANLYYDPVGASKFGDYILVKERPADTDLNADRLFELLVAAKERTKDPRLDLLERGNMQVRRFHMAIRDEASQEGEPWEQLNQVPFLTRIRRYKDRWEIVYIFIYAFNGPFTVCCKPQNAHSCDVEHVTVRTDPLAQRAEWVYYGAHGSADGVWKLPGEVEMRKGDMEWNTRPVVYAADFSQSVQEEEEEEKMAQWCLFLLLLLVAHNIISSFFFSFFSFSPQWHLSFPRPLVSHLRFRQRPRHRFHLGGRGALGVEPHGRPSDAFGLGAR